MHAGHRYAVNFVVVEMPKQGDEHGKVKQRTTWNIDFLQTKDQFPEALEEFLDSADYAGWQLATDNEAVLNSAKVKNIVKSHRMPPMRNSCEYQPWENGEVERPWRTLASGAREFLLRGFGDPVAQQRT